MEGHSIDDGNFVGISKGWLWGPVCACGMSDPTKKEQTQREDHHLERQLSYAGRGSIGNKKVSKKARSCPKSRSFMLSRLIRAATTSASRVSMTTMHLNSHKVGLCNKVI